MWVDNNDSGIFQRWLLQEQASAEKPKMSLKLTKTKPVVFCANSGYQATFEACFMDLGGLEENTSTTVLNETSRKHHSMVWFSINFHKVSLPRPIFRLGSLSHNSYKFLYLQLQQKLSSYKLARLLVLAGTVENRCTQK